MSAMNVMQPIAVDWAIRCFGSEHVTNRPVRALRLAEEAIELAQACGVGPVTMHRLVDVVYKRAEGESIQELGGVMITSLVMANVLGITLEEVTLIELLRCLNKPPEHFAKRNLEKIALGLAVEEPS